MRYVPNLIPKENKVLPEYFKGNPYKYSKGSTLLIILGYISACIFFLFALTTLVHIPLALLYATVGFILLPPGHKLIERKLRFKLTTKIKSIVCVLLCIATLPVFSHYYHLDLEAEKAVQAQQKIEEQKAVEAEKLVQSIRDTFNAYYEKIVVLEKSNKYEAASKLLDTALKYATYPSQIDTIQKERTYLTTVSMYSLFNKGRYKEALPLVSELISKLPNDADLLCKRAMCLHKTGNTQEAVNDLKTAMQLGSSEAESLHEKINPIKKRVAYYTTLCCDGTYSTATGRGACSWHGGVCDWNHPVYEEYRKYE